MNLFANFQTWSKQVVYIQYKYKYILKWLTLTQAFITFLWSIRHGQFFSTFLWPLIIVVGLCSTNVYFFLKDISLSALFSPFPFSLVVSIEGLGKWYYSLFCKMCPIHIHLFFWFFLCCKLAFIRENFIFAIYRW